MSLSVGARLGPYEILAQIGAGGMGEVYKARDTRLDRIVAIKISQQRFSERFEREARVVGGLNHPNICQLYDVGPDFLVMEFVEGVAIQPVDTPRRLLDLAIQIADGLSQAHASGVIHRDLKPDNILVTRDGRVKILDFGLAKLSADTTPGKRATVVDATRTVALTEIGSAIGTVGYMSPEQARGESNLTRQSDQFSFGVVLYELAAGKLPFKRSSAAETMTAIIREDAEPLPTAIPSPIRWTVDRLLAKDPAGRYDSTRDLYTDLRQIRDRLSETTKAAPQIASPTRERHSLRFVVTALLCLLAGASIATMLLPRGGLDLSRYKFTPLSRQDATERLPVWSPNGKSVAFTVSVNGILQVFTKSLESTDAAQLTHATSNCSDPFWSPEGSRLFYSSNNRLWAVSASGGDSEVIIENQQGATIHPDGKTVAFVREGKLWVSSLGGEAPREFGAKPFVNAQVNRVRFSPDGSRLLAGVESGNWLLPYPSGTPSKLAQGGDLEALNWFPDSRHLLYSEVLQNNNGSTLWRLDTRDGSREAIYRSTAPMIGATVAPDSKRIAYQTGQIEWNVLEVSVSSGAVRTTMSESGAISWLPDWAPAGTRYLVNTDRSGTLAIEEISAIDGFSRRLIVGEGGERVLAPRLSPDGSRFTFLSGPPDAPFRLLLANASGSNPTRLDAATGTTTTLVGALSLSSWSPDSQWITYGRRTGSTYQLVKLRPGSSADPIVLTEIAAANDPVGISFPVPVWSPAGDWIAYPKDEGLFLITPDGKTTRKLTARKLQTYGFAPDGHRLFGIYRDTTGKRAQWQLYVVDVKTGDDKLLAPIDLPASADSIAGFSMHPDGSRFLTSIAKWPFDIWMMEGFERSRTWRNLLFHQ
jgi:serine/threonine protein kinase